MMHGTDSLYQELAKTLNEVSRQISSEDKDPRVEVELLIAKANLLNGMANLKAADLNSKAVPRKR